MTTVWVATATWDDNEGIPPAVAVGATRKACEEALDRRVKRMHKENGLWPIMEPYSVSRYKVNQ